MATDYPGRIPEPTAHRWAKRLTGFDREVALAALESYVVLPQNVGIMEIQNHIRRWIRTVDQQNRDADFRRMTASQEKQLLDEKRVALLKAGVIESTKLA